MRKALGISLACVVALTATSYGKPADMSTKLDKPHFVELGARDAATIGSSLSGGGTSYIYVDTVTYGTTVWAADSARWEAVRGSGAGTKCWNFDTGIGSNYSEPNQYAKPAGYIHRAEGWIDIDNTFSTLTYFRRTGPGLPTNATEVTSTCNITGTASMWAGVNTAEANALCYAGGQGYGGNWNLTIAKTFAYGGSGTATFGYQYAVDAEPGFDYFIVSVDTTGTGAQDDVEITRYDGVSAGTASHTLVPGATMRSNAGNVTLKFTASSDGAYDDQDGAYSTACGLGAVDNVTLTGALSENATFETSNNGWNFLGATSGPGGLWMNVRSLTNLPPPLSFCPCAISDSVMIFADNTGGHNTAVDNIAVSPYCDLRAGGDAGKPGKLIIFHGYFELPLTNYIFVQTLASWYPSICPQTGLVYTKPLTSDGFVRFFGGVPNCSAPLAPVILNFSSVIEPGAEQVQIALGVLSFCAMFANCTGVTNSTPWFDKVSLGVYGAPGAPIVTLRTIDVFQDGFSLDGTLNIASAGRVDVNNIKGATNPQPGTAMGDTLVINGDGGNQEVKVVFRVRMGPYLAANQGPLTTWAAATGTHGWVNTGIAAPGYFGNVWWEARCDSSEQGGTVTAAKFMSTMWDGAGSGFVGTDTDRGGEGDMSQLTHDIFPDKILTPGSRIDYFIKARYLDSRNPGGTSQFITPDTTGRNYLEMEVLPSSMAADTSWNCTLHVDHRADRDALAQLLAEQGLTGTLGSGGNNAEGTKYDRYDVQAPSSQQGSFGRPLNTQYGASIIHTFAYKAIAWASGNLAAFCLVDEDANNLSAWLTITEVGGNRFWGSGDGLVRAMGGESEPTTINFLNNVMGVRFNCDTIRIAGCPTGSVLDSTFCLPLANVAGQAFTTTIATNARGNGCPNLRSFDVLQPNSAIPTARGQLTYVKSGASLAAPNFMSITNHNTVDVDYKTVVDGVEVGYLRDPNGSVNQSLLCNVTTPSITRTDNVFDWFQLPTTFGICKVPAAISDADDNIGTVVPKFRSSLGNAYPNPMNPTTRIKFTNGVNGGKVNISIYDVTGRLVKSLVDSPMTSGVHEITWDGSDNVGGSVSSGMYFIKMATKDKVESKKLVVSK